MPLDQLVKDIQISIHTLHTEGDDGKLYICKRTGEISIHTLHTEGDFSPEPEYSSHGYFNPHPPHGG